MIEDRIVTVGVKALALAFVTFALAQVTLEPELMALTWLWLSVSMACLGVTALRPLLTAARFERIRLWLCWRGIHLAPVMQHATFKQCSYCTRRFAYRGR